VDGSRLLKYVPPHPHSWIGSDGDSTPKWPNVPGRETFKGHIVHTAKWDHSYVFKGERVGVIGNGSSGMQIVPQLQKLVGDEGNLYNFIRGPTWVVPGYLQQFTPDGMGANFECTPSPFRFLPLYTLIDDPQTLQSENNALFKTPKRSATTVPA
jgi:hypothetical protein